MKTNDELNALSSDELNTMLLNLRKEQFTLRMKKANGALDKTHVVKVVRRNVARVKTIMKQKVGKSHDEK